MNYKTPQKKRDKYETDELLLTGFISAIHNLSFEIVDGKKNPLKSILHEEYAILLEHLVTQFMVALVVNKETYETRRKVQMIAEELNDITEWETDFKGMASAATKINIAPTMISNIEAFLNSSLTSIFIIESPKML